MLCAAYRHMDGPAYYSRSADRRTCPQTSVCSGQQCERNRDHNTFDTGTENNGEHEWRQSAAVNNSIETA
jgi:hypothetical protein